MSSDQADVAQPHSGCSILTIAPALSTARRFVSRVQALSDASAPSPVAANDIETPDSSLALSPSRAIPYTLVNRYYKADVQFMPYEIKSVSPALFSVASSSDFKPPPALIFTWVDGEPYAKHVEELSRLMASREYEPEVCLAVRLPKPESTADSEKLEGTSGEEPEEEDNSDIDGTMMEFGFEYVDATVEAAPRSAPRSEDTDDVPRLPRVLDALSTIMWPSMESASSTTKVKDASQPSARRLAERDALMEELFAVSEISGISAADNRAARMAAPERVQGGDVNSSEDDFSDYDFEAGALGQFVEPPSSSAGPEPWLKGTSTSTAGPAQDIVSSPVDIPGDASLFPVQQSLGKVSIGFEDDFTVFVSAPPPSSENASSFSHFDTDDEATSTSGLAPSSAITLGAGKMAYRSLGSVSDFGGDDAEDDWDRYQTLHDDDHEKQSAGRGEPDVDDLDDGWADEDGMPTKDEIMATAAKIFGAKSVVAKPPADGTENPTSKSTAARAPSAPHDDEVDSDDEIFAGSGGDIDITRVFEGLREMRSEIAAVEDEGERRRMAARVALGFVYGMDLDVPGGKVSEKK